MVGEITHEQMRQLFTALGEFRPDFIITSNYAGMDGLGIFGRFFEDARVPYVSWFTDTPRMILYERTVHCSHYAVAASWERAYVGHFEALGFEHVLHMPHATDPALFSGAPARSFARDVSFVGTSMIEHAEEAWDILKDFPEVTEALRRAFDEGRVTRETFAQGPESIVGEGIYAASSPVERRHLELCLVYEATRRMRRELVRAVEQFGVEVRGDPGWQQVARRCGGSINYFEDLAPYYRSSAVNLNVTSLQMKTAVNQRVFDCPAAGGFLITDAQEDLDELFEPEREVVTFSSLEELREKTAYYLAHEEERRGIVERAQRRITADHTHAHRLQALERYLRARYEG